MLSSQASSSAASSAQAAGAAASKRLAAAGQQGIGFLDAAQKDALGRIDPYRMKLDYLPGILANSVYGNINLIRNGPAAALGKSVDSYNQVQLDKYLGHALPGAREMVRLASNNTLSMLRGEVPADVASASRRRSAQGAITGGFSGSESSDALTARDLGTTSLNLMQEGSNSAQRWISTARSQLMPALFDPTSQLASPALTLSSILDAAGLAKDQSEIVTSTAARKAGILIQSQGAATNAQLDGTAAGIRATQQGANQLAGGIERAAGIIGGMYAPGGAAGGGNAGLADSGFYGTQSQAVTAGGAGSSAAFYKGTGEPGASSGWYISG